MKIVVLCDSGTIDGGAAKVAISTAIALKAHVEAVTFVAGMGHADELRDADIETLDLQQTWFFDHKSKLEQLKYLVSNPIVERRFGEFLKGFDPRDTIVHVHLCADKLSSVVIEVAARAGFPVVYTCHDHWLACPTGMFFDFRRESICHLNPLSPACVVRNCTKHSYSAKAMRIARSGIPTVLHGLHRKIARFLYVTEMSKRVIEPHVHSGTRGQVLYNPVDIEFGPAADVAAHETFFWLGRLTTEKGPDILARAAKIADVPIAFAGDGPLSDMVRAENPRAEFLGWIGPHEIRKRFACSRALVMTSRCYEAGPLVVQEAAAAGLPVIVPDTCAAQEFMSIGETGLTFRGEDAESLASAMVQLKDGGKAASMGRAGYDRLWSDPPTMEKHISALLEVYQAVLRDRRKS